MINKKELINHMYSEMLHKCLNGTETVDNPYHLEKTVLDHTIMVLNKVEDLFKNDKDYKVLMFGAALHDLGKIFTREVVTKDNGTVKVRFLNHENVGVYYACDVLSKFNLSEEEIIKIIKIVAYHDIYKYDIDKLKIKFTYDDLQLLCKFSMCDSLGRVTHTPKSTDIYKQIRLLKPYETKPIDITKPTITMLIGVPGVGKSTLCNQYENVISRDDILMSYGKTKFNLDTYSEIWSKLSQDDQKEIDNIFKFKLNRLLQQGKDIVIDKTNTSMKSRKSLLNSSSLIKNYNKVAIVMLCPYNTILERIEKRSLETGKEISKDIVDNFIKSMCLPTLEEFDEIAFKWSI
ncbi:putative polynucleotide 5' kinase and 3' phosphatase [Campylobacter phage F352]|uniref:Putative polynucleotide 5' kinase and 3' phosphatase n=3 Tax=Fletchervirus CPX TaxID=1110702 RepID=A0A7T3N4Q3_9CAUD|nr:putative polynucleotide 5' kinase and 3' phosphatase [Campylobacter phage F352]QPX65521.1 putative polynucleotide 5' kinase and 3' phosphatase [Campylobacter phage F374]QPX65688.1 putative polynucleotide 5' kinase and 3' phosphatase [Campylobacter phage F375]